MKLAILTLILVSATSVAWATDLQDFQGTYTKVCGDTIGTGPATCPQTIQVTKVNDNEVDTTSNDRGFDGEFSFGGLDKRYFGCSNHGNPIANECYRTRLRGSTLETDGGEVTNLLPELLAPMNVMRSWSMTKDGAKLVFKYTVKNSSGSYASDPCVYTPSAATQ